MTGDRWLDYLISILIIKYACKIVSFRCKKVWIILVERSIIGLVC